MNIEGSAYESLSHLNYQLILVRKKISKTMGRTWKEISIGRSQTAMIKLCQKQLEEITNELEQAKQRLTPTIQAKLPNLLTELKPLVSQIEETIGSLQKTHNTSILKTLSTCQTTITETYHVITAQIVNPSYIQLPGFDTIESALISLCSKGIDRLLDNKRALKEIEDKKVALSQKLTQYPSTLTFCNKISQHTISFLKEHLLNIQDRDPSIRPEFLSHFFHDPYIANPEPTWLGKLVIPLLTNHEELFSKIINVNLLQAIETSYRRLQSIQDTHPFFLVDIVKKAMSSAVEHIEQEKKVREEQGINPLTIQERNLLLNNTVQKNIIETLCTIALPQGSTSIFIPNILPHIFKKAGAEDYIKKTIFPLIKEGLQDLLSDTFSELSQNDDLKCQILIQGYEHTIAFLENRPTISAPKQKTDSKFKLASLGFVITLFSIFFSALSKISIRNKKEVKPIDYPHHEELAHLLERSIYALTKGSRFLSFIVKKFSKKLIENLLPELINTTQSISLVTLVDEQLATLTKVIVPDDESTLPKQIEDKERLLAKKQEELEKNKASLLSLRERFGKDLSGLARILASAIIEEDLPPEEGEALSKRIRFYVRKFLRSCLYQTLRFIFWLVRATKKAKGIEAAFYEATEMIQQDALLTTVARFASEKLGSKESSRKERNNSKEGK